MANLLKFPEVPAHVAEALPVDLAAGPIVLTDRKPDHTPLAYTRVLETSQRIWGTERYGSFALDLLAHESAWLGRGRLLMSAATGRDVGGSRWFPYDTPRLLSRVTYELISAEYVLGRAGAMLEAAAPLVPYALQARALHPDSRTSAVMDLHLLPPTVESVQRAFAGRLGKSSLRGAIGKAYDALGMAVGALEEPRQGNRSRFRPDKRWVAWSEVIRLACERGVAEKARSTMSRKARGLVEEQIETAAPLLPAEFIVEGACTIKHSADLNLWLPSFEYVKRSSLVALAADYPEKRQTAGMFAFLEELVGRKITVDRQNANRRRRGYQSY